MGAGGQDRTREFVFLYGDLTNARDVDGFVKRITDGSPARSPSRPSRSP